MQTVNCPKEYEFFKIIRLIYICSYLHQSITGIAVKNNSLHSFNHGHLKSKDLKSVL
jgi:hypothetical protein